MPQDFDKTFSPTEDVVDTMRQLIDDSLEALQSNFSGGTEVPAGIRIASQWWSDTTNQMLKLRNVADSGWLDVYDFDLGHVHLENDQVDTAHISSTARKGTIVSGEDITPNSCSLKTPYGSSSIPGIPNELFDLVANLGSLGGGGWRTLYTSRIYIPAEAGTLYVIARQSTCSMRFSIGVNVSSGNSPIDPGPSWGTEESIDVSTLNGWYDLEIQGLTNQGMSPYGGFSGLSCRWG